jgi:hypothetical protein
MDSMVVDLFASTITETIGDTSFGCSASMVVAVVLYFLSHLALLFAVRAKGRKNVAALRRWIALRRLPVLVLRTCLVDRAASAAAAFAHIERDLISKLDGLEILSRELFLASIRSLTSMSGVTSLLLSTLSNPARRNPLRAGAGLDGFLNMLARGDAARWSMSTSVS